MIDARKYQQVQCIEVISPEMVGAASLEVWVDADKGLKIGNIVTFKETGDRRWCVVDIYETKIDKPNRGWGLDLPKSQRTER